MKLLTAFHCVVEDLRDLDPDRYRHPEDIDVYLEWLNDGPRASEIDEAERGRVIDTETADAYRLVLRVGYRPVWTVVFGNDAQVAEVDRWLEREAAGVDVLGPARLVVAS